jgi:uncharacterized protein (DUF1786 family)
VTEILAVDVGTGTQDVYLYRSGRSIENGYRLVLPAPTMQLRWRIQEATRRREPLLLTGVTMGGGPMAWAAEAHRRAGLPLRATADAARTFNDDLEWVRHEMGVEILSEDEAARIDGGVRLELRDLDFPALAAAFDSSGVRLQPSVIAVAVFDHGAAPPGYSDRQFRFDYLETRLRAQNRLSAFAYLAADVPAPQTRLRAVARSAQGLDSPVLLMDTAPAAVLGAMLDRSLGNLRPVLVVNVGNFHTLAFRMGEAGVEGLFEHHTGEIDQARLVDLLDRLAQGSLRHAEVFDDNGHGAIVFSRRPMPTRVGVIGPRRDLLIGSRLPAYFAVPFGDMMMAGCFGLLAACADHLPAYADEIRAAFAGADAGTPPWESDP